MDESRKHPDNLCFPLPLRIWRLMFTANLRMRWLVGILIRKVRKCEYWQEYGYMEKRQETYRSSVKWRPNSPCNSLYSMVKIVVTFPLEQISYGLWFCQVQPYCCLHFCDRHSNPRRPPFWLSVEDWSARVFWTAMLHRIDPISTLAYEFRSRNGRKDSESLVFDPHAIGNSNIFEPGHLATFLGIIVLAHMGS